MPAIISWTNAADSPLAELDVSSEVSGLGPRALLTPQIADIYRSGLWTVGAVITLSVDLGAVQELRLIALAAPADGVLPASGATVRVTASAAAPGAQEALDTGVLPLAMPSGVWAFLTPAPINARYVRLLFTAGAGDQYLQLGKLWIAAALVTESSSAYGQQLAFIDAGSNARAGVSGVRYATQGAMRRQPQWSLPGLTAADKAGVEAAAREAGTTRQVFASPLALTPGADGVFGHFVTPPAVRLISHRRWSAEISIDEDL